MNQSVKFEHRELMVKELRVGNLIEGFWEEEDDDGEYVERYGLVEVLALDVTRSLGDGWAIMVESKHKQEIEHYDGFYGATLTEEWLEKFGFEKITDDVDGVTNYDYLLEIGGYEAVGDWSEGGELLGVNVECIERTLKYVHELQNLVFFLTGEELKMKSDSLN